MLEALGAFFRPNKICRFLYSQRCYVTSFCLRFRRWFRFSHTHNWGLALKICTLLLASLKTRPLHNLVLDVHGVQLSVVGTKS